MNKKGPGPVARRKEAKRMEIINKTINDPVRVSQTHVNRYRSSSVDSSSKDIKSFSKERQLISSKTNVSQVNNPDQYIKSSSTSKRKNGKIKDKRASYFSYGNDRSLDMTSVNRSNGTERIVSGERAKKIYDRVVNRMDNSANKFINESYEKEVTRASRKKKNGSENR